MSKSLMLPVTLVLCAGLLAAPLRSQAAPEVAVDIPPVHSLVAQVMDGVGTPALIIGGGASPHGYSLRPSEARALQAADLVVWVGPTLTPWLGMALPTLAADAEVLSLADSAATRLLEARTQASFALVPQIVEGHDHSHGHEHAEDAARPALPADPHVWLDPGNAKAWLPEIAEQLARLDPDNAGRYRENALAAQAGVDALEADLERMLAPVQGGQYVVFHDGYQYFERAFDMPAAGAIALSDASDPSPARIAEVRGVVQQGGISCVFSEPQLNPALIGPVFEGTEVSIAVADPLGATLEPGPALYGEMMRSLASALADCLR